MDKVKVKVSAERPQPNLQKLARGLISIARRQYADKKALSRRQPGDAA